VFILIIYYKNDYNHNLSCLFKIEYTLSRHKKSQGPPLIALSTLALTLLSTILFTLFFNSSDFIVQSSFFSFLIVTLPSLISKSRQVKSSNHSISFDMFALLPLNVISAEILCIELQQEIKAILKM